MSHGSGKPTKYFLEQPRDPEEWIKEEDTPEYGAPSFTVWPETQWLIEQLDLRVSRIDQGALGHPVRKPTALISNLEEVAELDGLRCDSYDPAAWDIPLPQRIEKSKNLAAWAGWIKRSAVQGNSSHPSRRSTSTQDTDCQRKRRGTSVD